MRVCYFYIYIFLLVHVFLIHIVILFCALDAVMYRVMQVGSSGEMIELPQIVTGNFTSGTTQPALINPLNSKCI